MLGAGVFNEKGALLGEVKDRVVDPSQGDVTHAIVATGGSVTGGAQRLSAVPWGEIRAAMRNDRIMLDESRLKGAPSFSISAWPDFKSRNWSSEVDRHWRARSE
jgi:sporulation protein YlmC with PRC-barrel domain